MSSPSRYVIFLFILILCRPSSAQTRTPAGDAPEISRSAGVEGGVVVLWPRVVPRSQRVSAQQLAASAQQRLAGLVRKHLPGKPVDVRPEPERVCRQAGCKAMSVGALIVRKQRGCVVLAVISRPGPSPARLIPWVGKVTLKILDVPFRQPPESFVTIDDFAPCAQAANLLREKEKDVVDGLVKTAAH
jgi:hypothetical protein